MNVEIEITVGEKLDKTQVLNVAKIINRVFDDTVVGGKGKKIADIKSNDEGFLYLFSFESENDEKVCDTLASELYVGLDFDFSLEVECGVDEDYLEPCDDKEEVLTEDSESVQHSRWLNESMKQGWRYGAEYSEDKKTNPLLRPYHLLTEAQHKVLQKSKNKLGYYGVHVPYLVGTYGGYYGGHSTHDGHETGDSFDGADGGGDGGGE